MDCVLVAATAKSLAEPVVFRQNRSADIDLELARKYIAQLPLMAESRSKGLQNYG
jgi:hypothetical protein